MSNPTMTYLVMASCAGLIALTALVMDISADDLQQQQELYCQMVAIHKDTGGEYGWPDYKHIAEEACQ